MISDYAFIFIGLMAVVIFALAYSKLQTFLQQRTSSMNKKFGHLLKVIVNIGIIFLIGIAFYLLFAGVISAVQGTKFIWGIKF